MAAISQPKLLPLAMTYVASGVAKPLSIQRPISGSQLTRLGDAPACKLHTVVWEPRSVLLSSTVAYQPPVPSDQAWDSRSSNGLADHNVTVDEPSAVICKMSVRASRRLSAGCDHSMVPSLAMACRRGW